MFKYRLISFPLLLFLVYLIFFQPQIGKWLFSALAVAGAGIMLWEAGSLAEKIKVKNYPKLCGIMGSLFALVILLALTGTTDWSTFWNASAPLFVMTIGIAGVAAMFMLLLKQHKKLRRVAGSLGVLAVFGTPVFMLIPAYFGNFSDLFLAGDFKHLNTPLLLYVICAVKSMDTGGYIFGMTTARLLPGGNHKIAPSISPAKSWEGFFGGLLLGLGVGMIFRWFLGGSIGFYLLHGTVFALLSFFGDLTESALKRSAGVKDSASWIPGMGGIFDVFDSFLYVGFYLFLNTFQWW